MCSAYQREKNNSIYVLAKISLLIDIGYGVLYIMPT